MDSRTLRLLEFDRIQAMLAEETSFGAGRELALALQPSANPIWVEEGLAETTEAVEVLGRHGEPPFGGLTDIRPLVERAEIGATLEPGELLDVARAVAGARRLARFVRQHAAPDGILADLAAAIESHDALERELSKCIGEDGEVLDRASEALARLRSRERTLQARIRDRIQGILRDLAGRNVLQESLVTVRGGRFVLPVKQEHRAAVPGILHDQSGSGATVFIEPAPIVEIGNELRGVEAEIAQEVARILRRLSGLVAANGPSLRRAVAAAARLDLAFAKARLSRRWDGVRPVLNREGWLNIRQGRHPLLGEPVVPIDLYLGREFTALVVTGPNTGGKTVTLKTAGLFVLMAQAGLHLPAAEGTEIPLLDGVFADIGDEQSIEQSLSTFSAHMRHIVEILSKAGPNTLVLLDELGAGTDPAEGAALAMAILEHLVERGARVIATTHLGELKSFAFHHDRVENASVEFDAESLRPTYRLAIGVAGSSNAFHIARRLGLPPALIERAKARLTQEELRVEELLQRIEADLQRAEQERKAAERLRAELASEKERYERARQQLHLQREELLAEARREAERLVREARREVDQWIGRIRRRGAEADEQEALEGREALAALAERVAASEKARRAGGDAGAPHTGMQPLQVAPGDRVFIRSLRQEGEVRSGPDSGGHVVVQSGALRLTVPLGDLERVESRPHIPSGKETGRRAAAGGGWAEFTRSAAQHAASELHIRGMRVEESMQLLDKFLDDAVLANLPRVRVVHGKGSGTLQRAVHERLRADPRVRSFQFADPAEGGYGVTVVEL